MTKELSYTLPIVGAHFRPPAKAILAVLPASCRMTLVLEPSNPYDPNAVAVFVASEDIPEDQHEPLHVAADGYGSSIDEILAQPAWMLGYIPRTEAVSIAPRIALASAHETEPGVWSAVLGFTMEGKPAVTFSLPEPEAA